MGCVSNTTEYGIWLSCETNTNIIGYSDSDWAGRVDDTKSTSGGCFFIGNNLVAWHSKKKTSTSLSTSEAEYIAARSCCTQLLWMKQMLSDYGIEQGPMVVFCSNQDAIDISKNPIQHLRTKHIYFFDITLFVNWSKIIYSPWSTFPPNTNLPIFH